MSDHTARHYELSDEQWGLIEDLFPQPQPRKGRPWREHHTIINGIFSILCSGAAWRDLPECYGPWQTVYDRFAQYRNDGTFDCILERLQLERGEHGLIDTEHWMADSTKEQPHLHEKLRRAYLSPLLLSFTVQPSRAASDIVTNGRHSPSRNNSKITN